MRSIFLFGLTASLLLSIATRAQENWPRFRGADGAGVAQDNPMLPETWGREENVQWVTDIPGLGWSSPIVWGDRVFITSAYSDKEQDKPKEGYLS